MTSLFQHYSSLRRLVLFGLLLINLFAIGFALYLQQVFDESPCPLCILQRYAFFGIVIFVLLAFITKPSLFNRFMLFLAGISTLSGATIAGHQLWVAAHPKLTCGLDTMEPVLNNWLLAKWFPNVFAVQGVCQLPPEPLLGLSIPTWSIIIFIITLLGLVATILSEYKVKQNRYN